MSKDYYNLLGLSKSATQDDIKKAFRKMAHEHHPDKNKGNTSSEQKFKEASEAYSVLSDDNKRAQYDRFGSAGPGGTGFNSGQGGFGAQGFGGFDFSQLCTVNQLGKIFVHITVELRFRHRTCHDSEESYRHHFNEG